jgi:hypothetical protein
MLIDQHFRYRHKSGNMPNWYWKCFRHVLLQHRRTNRWWLRRVAPAVPKEVLPLGWDGN